jgi:transcriptional regulator with XRE-family HTH domain
LRNLRVDDVRNPIDARLVVPKSSSHHVGMARPTDAGKAAAGRAVRIRRGDHGWTQQELADKAEISVDTVSDLEAGRRWPWTRTIRALEMALGLERGELDRIATEPPVLRPDLYRDLVGEVGEDDAKAVAEFLEQRRQGREP